MLTILKRKALWFAAAAVIIMLIAVAMRPNPLTVKTLKLEPGELRVIVNATTTSTVKSENEVTLSAQRTGRVTRLPVKEGDRVNTGTLIAQLDLTEESVQSENALKQSKATFEEAEKNLKRMEDLFSKGMVSQQDLDAVRRAYDIAQSQYRASTEDVTVRQGYSIIRAPFDGVIAKKFTEVGELLLPGKQIVTMVDPERIYVLSTIDEVDVGRLRTGLPVVITVDAFPGEKFDGVIRRISPIVSGGKLETRTADVWIYFSKKASKIKPGMSADVEILLSTLQNVLSVPSQTVIDRDGKKQVYVIAGNAVQPGKSYTANLRPVEIGETNWSFTEITGGLSAGTYVITTPEVEGLKDGSKVRIEEQ
ncbi:MAG TPA: efflux RND transporter periplasmic adaptor subunit [Nitrospirota bacterium]|nr:efflux RND transporter periplasmic adaptor subunit [Nitrospirota bacterium]